MSTRVCIDVSPSGGARSCAETGRACFQLRGPSVDDAATPAERRERRRRPSIVRLVMEKFFEGTLRLFGSAGVDQHFRFRTQRLIGLRGGFDRPRQ